MQVTLKNSCETFTSQKKNYYYVLKREIGLYQKHYSKTQKNERKLHKTSNKNKLKQVQNCHNLAFIVFCVFNPTYKVCFLSSVSLH